jgi:hypothetical protein
VVLGCRARSELLHVEHAELARRKILSFKTEYQILTRVVKQESARVHTDWNQHASPANADWYRDSDIEGELKGF